MMRVPLLSTLLLSLLACEEAGLMGDDGGSGTTDASRDVGGRDMAVSDAEPASDLSGPDLGALPMGRLAVLRAGEELVEGSSLAIGRILIGSPGASFRLDLVNLGTGPLQVDAPEIVGSASSDYTVEPVSPVALASTSSRAYSVRFQPTASSTRSAELRFRSDDPGQPLFRVSLEGVGVSRDELPSDTNGNWEDEEVTIYDTREARIIVRVGDIDNLGFGWPRGFDPFSGQDTPRHSFPWTPESTDPPATDRIMVVSSYDGSPPAGRDGYTATTRRPDNLPAPITLRFDLRGSLPYSAVLQLFVDDFQAPVWRANYQALLDGERWPLLEDVLNTLVQTGPIGKLITVPLAPEQLSALDDGILELFVDDPATGAGDGFAFDFAKLFIDVYGFSNLGSIEGTVTDESTGLPIVDATVSASGLVSVQTDGVGRYSSPDVPAGFVYLRVTKDGYQPTEEVLDLRAGASVTRDLVLAPE
ncbi:MAG: carboxypeptidase regulatory-like domain-containing protein [Myxococcota bacterium]